jgi:Phage stabilisation protein
MPFQFVGGSYTSLSLDLDSQRSLNLYYESDESGLGKNRAALMGTPGLSNFALLPKSPVRGILATSGGRLFVVAGDTFYELNPTTGAQINARTPSAYVGDDSVHSPVTMFENGTQVMIVSAGLVWIDDSITIDQAFFANGAGFVTAAGTAVTWIAGSPFDSSNVGQAFVIGGTGYTVASPFIDASHLTLTTSAGSVGSTVTGTCDVAGTAVTWDSGAYFNSLNFMGAGGGVITIGGTVYTIASVASGTSLTLVTPGISAGVAGATWTVTLGVAYTASYPVAAAPNCGAYLDSYYIVAQPFSRQINISAPNDGKSWDPIDFGIKEGQPDHICSLLSDHEELWIFGTNTIEVWNDTGAAAFPLQRNPSGFIPIGCAAAASPTRLSESVAWIGGDSRGACIAYMASGFIPTRVSTYAVEAAWKGYSRIDDAVSYSYIDQGHQFWMISFPTAGTTWAYDTVEKLWHERGSYNGTVIGQHRALTHAFVANRHIVGDYSTGYLYVMATSIDNEVGQPIYRIRACPYVANSTLWTYFSEFLLDLEDGTSATSVLLDWSDDGGVTFCTPITAASFEGRIMWRRLGKSRRRVFRVTYSGSGRVAWINGFVDATNGTT